LDSRISLVLYVIAGALIGAVLAGSVTFGIQGISVRYIGWDGVFLKISSALIAGGLLGGIVAAGWSEMKRTRRRKD
jgi:hypothetical protein